MSVKTNELDVKKALEIIDEVRDQTYQLFRDGTEQASEEEIFRIATLAMQERHNRKMLLEAIAMNYNLMAMGNHG